MEAADGGLAGALAQPTTTNRRRLLASHKDALRLVAAVQAAEPGLLLKDAIIKAGVSHSTYYLAKRRADEIEAKSKPGAVASDAEAFGTAKRGPKPGVLRERRMAEAQAELKGIRLGLGVNERHGAARAAQDAGDEAGSELETARAIMRLLEPFDLPARARIATAACVLAKAIRPWRET